METQGAQDVKTPLSRQPKEDSPGFSCTHSPYKAADKVLGFFQVLLDSMLFLGVKCGQICFQNKDL